MGKTIAAEMRPCTVPDRTFSTATNQIGHGAWTRSSISRGEAKLLGHAQGNGLHALEHDGKADDARYQHRREGGLRHRPVPANALADLREDEEKHEAQQERLDQGANDKLAEVLFQYHQVA